MSQFHPTPAPDQGTPDGANRGRTVKIAAIVVALLLVVSGIAYAVSRNQGNPPIAATPAPTTQAPATDAPAPSSSEPTPASSPSSAPTPAAPAPGPSSKAAPAGCTTADGLIHDPTKFKVEARGVDSRMITVGKDSDGNPGAPPPSESQTTAYYSGSPEVGATRGNTILTIHTYSPKNGANALGNKLYSDTQGLKVGDVIKITDGDGKQVCYRYTGNKKVWVNSYDPKSGVFHNLTGPPQLAIMICWDHNASNNEWDSRIIFYASLIPVGQ
ncbi:class F sortase [Mariniluteicoccus flavus]